MTFASSLRIRLLVLILAPLALIAALMGYWRYTVALETAGELFDRALLSAAIAVSRDVTVSGGDALSISTRDLIAQASGGQVLYHVEGPDRAYVTGYAYPPIPPETLPRIEGKPLYYAAEHQGTEVAALRIAERAQADTLLGFSTVTVWQRRDGREAFASALALQSAILIGTLVLAVGLIIWFGVNRGLRPLLDLEDAIAARTPDDLSRIRRVVPREVRGIVSTLNDLFEKVQGAIASRDVFISNAAHQLRNPVAGMLSLTEAVDAATTEQEREARLAELKEAAQRTARLTTQMLAIERIKGSGDERFERLDLNELASDVATRNAERALKADLEFNFNRANASVMVLADRVMIQEAIENLIDNAIKHGGADLTRVEVSVTARDGGGTLIVKDDGQGISREDVPTAIERFGQVRPSSGSGLGLAIVSEIASMHGGSLEISGSDQGATVSLSLKAHHSVDHRLGSDC